jgi:hypothetical protein
MWKEQEYGTRRCINCGYLGKKDTTGFEEECFIASAGDRINGQLSSHRTLRVSIGQFITLPWCSVDRANLKDEVDQLDSPQTENKRIFDVIAKDRKCQWWYPWREFYSPKEMYADSMMLAMRKGQQDFEMQMEKDRKEFDLRLFEMSQRIEKDNKAIVERSDRFNRRITWLIVLLAILGTVLTFFQLAFPDGIPWLIKLFTK